MTITAPEAATLLATPLRLTAPLTLATDDEGEPRREFTALGVPYEVEVDRRNWTLGTTRLRIAAGACAFRPDAKLFFGHDWQVNGTPVGRVVKADDTTEGPRILGRLWTTLKADEVYALMQPDEDGVAVLDKVSIGFYITEYTVEGADTDAPVLVVTGADVFETSIVPFPQYDGAAVDNVLHVLTQHPEGTPMPQAPSITDRPTEPETFSAADGAALSAAVAALDTNVEALGAKIATLNTGPIPDTPAELFGSSYGEYVKALLGKDPDAEKFAQAMAAGDYEGGKSPDTIYRDTWVGETLRLIEKARKVWNLFDSGTLPAEGTTLEYGKLAANTIKVEEQANEGDAIVMGNVKIGTDHADVYTFAGGSKLTFQQALRSNINVLDLHFRALAIAYGNASEKHARDTLDGLDAKKLPGLSLASLDDFDGWIDLLVDAAMHFDDKGLAPEFLRLSPDQFKRLAKIREGIDGPYLLSRETGRINLLEQTGDVAGLRIAMTPGTAKVELGNSFALKTFESAGAPARLGPEDDILHLTKAIGVYGFGAIAEQDPHAIVRVPAVAPSA